PLVETGDPLRADGPNVAAAKTEAKEDVAGLLPKGAYSYRLTFYDDTKKAETNASDAISATITQDHQIKLTKIPRGPAGTTNRKIYRLDPGATEYKLVDQIDNAVAEYVDNKV